MKATAFIRKTASKNDTDSVATIYFRLRDGKKDIKAASELTISPNHWLSTLIDKYHHPNRYKTKEEIEAENKPLLLELFSEFLVKHKLSEVRKKNFRVIHRALTRYELYVRTTKREDKRALSLMWIW